MQHHPAGRLGLLMMMMVMQAGECVSGCQTGRGTDGILVP